MIGKLISTVGKRGEDSDLCRIAAVTICGSILDVTVEISPYVEAEVTVEIGPGELAGIGMRRIEKTLRYIDESLHTSLVLNST